MDFNGFSTKAKILILFANAYDMKDEMGDRVSGCSVHYLFWGENGESMIPMSETDATKPVGMQRAKCSVDAILRNKIQIAPAIYEGDFEMKTGSDGKPVLRLKDVAYVSNVEMKEKVIPGLYVPGMKQPEAFETKTEAKK